VNLANATSTTGTTLPTTAGKVTVKGGTGNDTIIATGTLTADVSIAAGDGTDVLKVAGTPNISAIGALTSVETLDFNALNGAQALTLTPTQFNNFTTLTDTGTGTVVTDEKVVFSAAGTVNADVASKATLVSYDASALAGATTYNVLSGQVTNLTTVTLKGSSAALTDTLAFTGNNAVAVSAATNLAGIENISFANTSTTVSFVTGAATIGSGNGVAYTNPVTVTNVASSSTFKFDASGNSADRFNITNLATGGKSSISGGGGVDTIVGAAGTDVLDGGAGSDIITGAGGSDTLVGGTGNDTFIFNTGDVVSGETLVDHTDNTGSTADTIKVVTSTDFTDLTTATILTAGKVEQILITSGQTATFTGAQLTGQAINVNATAAATAALVVTATTNATTSLATMTFTAASGDAFNTGVDTVTINGAGGTNTIDGTTIADTITGTGTGTDTIDGKAGADTISGGAGSDVITGGTGADRLTGDADNDTFVITTGDGSAFTAAAGTFTGYDTITDFTTTADTIKYLASDTVNTSAGKQVAADNKAYVFANNQSVNSAAVTTLAAADFANVDKVITYINAVATNTAGAGMDFIVAVNDATAAKAAIYHVANTAGNEIIATEVELIGVTTGVVAAVDFVA
jgi:Ca2+-binding RTX toxin-like protein